MRSTALPFAALALAWSAPTASGGGLPTPPPNHIFDGSQWVQDHGALGLPTPGPVQQVHVGHVFDPNSTWSNADAVVLRDGILYLAADVGHMVAYGQIDSSVQDVAILHGSSDELFGLTSSGLMRYVLSAPGGTLMVAANLVSTNPYLWIEEVRTGPGTTGLAAATATAVHLYAWSGSALVLTDTIPVSGAIDVSVGDLHLATGLEAAVLTPAGLTFRSLATQSELLFLNTPGGTTGSLTHAGDAAFGGLEVVAWLEQNVGGSDSVWVLNTAEFSQLFGGPFDVIQVETADWFGNGRPDLLALTVDTNDTTVCWSLVKHTPAQIITTGMHYGLAPGNEDTWAIVMAETSSARLGAAVMAVGDTDGDGDEDLVAFDRSMEKIHGVEGERVTAEDSRVKYALFNISPNGTQVDASFVAVGLLYPYSGGPVLPAGATDIELTVWKREAGGGLAQYLGTFYQQPQYATYPYAGQLVNRFNFTDPSSTDDDVYQLRIRAVDRPAEDVVQAWPSRTLYTATGADTIEQLKLNAPVVRGWTGELTQEVGLGFLDPGGGSSTGQPGGGPTGPGSNGG